MYCTVFSANVVAVLGKKRAINLMHQTEMINAQGGMMTNVSNGKRVSHFFLLSRTAARVGHYLSGVQVCMA